MINRIYRGGRASGKTVSLVKKADECMKNGFTPVFIYSYPAVRETIRTCADYLNIDCSEWLFATYQEYSASRCYNTKRELVKPTRIRIPDNHVVLIDEAETFIDNLFKCRDVNSALPNILITESDADYKIVKCDWKKEETKR